MHNYTEEQVKDIQDREAKALETLKELELTPASFVQKINLNVDGKDVFADHVTAFLADTKYSKKPVEAEVVSEETPENA